MLMLLLLDSGNPSLKIKSSAEPEGFITGNSSRRIRDNSEKPVFLACGSNPENVKQAIEEVNPFGIDVCSGIRINGKLDLNRLENFMKNAGY